MMNVSFKKDRKSLFLEVSLDLCKIYIKLKIFIRYVYVVELFQTPHCHNLFVKKCCLLYH